MRTPVEMRTPDPLFPGKMGAPIGRMGTPDPSGSQFSHECLIPKPQPMKMEEVTIGKHFKTRTVEMCCYLCDSCYTDGYAISSRIR